MKNIKLMMSMKKEIRVKNNLNLKEKKLKTKIMIGRK